MGRKHLSVFPLLLAMACGTATVPEGPSIDGRRNGGEAGSGVVITLAQSSYDCASVITLAQSSYDWDAVQQGASPQATVTNDTDDAIWLRAGDGFAPETQEQIFIARGSDAGIERQTSGGWQPVEIDLMLMEGAGLVRIPAGATYPIRGGFGSKRSTGTHRIRIEYYADRDRSPDSRKVAVSAPFTVD